LLFDVPQPTNLPTTGDTVGILVSVTFTVDPDTWDPATSSAALTEAVVAAAFEGLLGGINSSDPLALRNIEVDYTPPSSSSSRRYRNRRSLLALGPEQEEDASKQRRRKLLGSDNVGTVRVSFEVVGSLSLLGHASAGTFQSVLEASLQEAVADGSLTTSTIAALESLSSCGGGSGCGLGEALAAFTSPNQPFPTLQPTTVPTVSYKLQDVAYESPQAILVFAASNGEQASGGGHSGGGGQRSVRGGWRGLQLWRSDGTPQGTELSFEQTFNAMDVDVEALDQDWPPQLAAYGGSLYYPANAGTGAASLPKGFAAKHLSMPRVVQTSNTNNNMAAVAGTSRSSGGDGQQQRGNKFVSVSEFENEEVITGVDVAFSVSDVDTLPGDGGNTGNGNGNGGGGGALTLRLSCAKGRLTFGYLLRNADDGGGADFGSGGGTYSYSGGLGGRKRGLRGVRGLVFTEGDGVDDDHFTVVGSAAAINEALQDLRYRGKDGHEGWDEVKVSLSDSPLDVCARASPLFGRSPGGLTSSIKQRVGGESRSGGGSSTLESATTTTTTSESGHNNKYESDAHNVSASMRWFAESWLAETAMRGGGGGHPMGSLRGPDTHQGGAPVGWDEQVPSRSGEVHQGSAYPAHMGQGAGKSGGSGIGSDSNPLEDEQNANLPGQGPSRTNTNDNNGNQQQQQQQGSSNFSFCDYGASHKVQGKIEVYLSAVNHAPVITLAMMPQQQQATTTSSGSNGRGSLPYDGPFEVGMAVRIRRVGVAEAVALQQGHGGWSSSMADMLGMGGSSDEEEERGLLVVQRVDRNQDVMVHGKVWNQALLEPVVATRIGTAASDQQQQQQQTMLFVVTAGPEPSVLPSGALVVSDPDNDNDDDVNPPFTVTLRTVVKKKSGNEQQQQGSGGDDGGLRLSLASIENLALLDGCDGVEDGSITLVGSLVDVNRAINGLHLLCDPARTFSSSFSSSYPAAGASASSSCGVGWEYEVVVLVDDNGYSGRGGAMTATASFAVTVVGDKESTGEDDGDASVSYDEFNHGYTDSSGSDEAFGNNDDNDDDDAEAADDDGSGLADEGYEHGGGGSSSSSNSNDDDEAGGGGEGAGANYPAGSLSWHDVKQNYGALEEEPRTHRLGDGDFWDE
jgi:hypothetical protein